MSLSHICPPVRTFERILGRRAEALDCLAYAHAARQIITTDWERRRADVARLEPAASRPGPVLKSSWMERLKKRGGEGGGKCKMYTKSEEMACSPLLWLDFA